MTTPRQHYAIDEIKAMLLDRVDQVARHYAPPAAGSYTDKGGYFTLNPGRPDRHVGSFVIWTAGPKAGQFIDFATGEHGDLIDLIRLAQGGSLSDALREARGFLGLASDNPADAARRAASAARARAMAAEARSRDAEARETRRRMALALWLRGRESIAGTPAEHYLRDARGIDLRQLGRQPRALRFMAECYYKHIDPTTGEVIEGRWPALLALATAADGKPAACHRTYLEFRDGRWQKAALPAPKKVLGDYAGASIHLWRGLGPRGGAGRRLSEAEPGSHVYIAEGIEDALSCVTILPEARVLSAISLSNLARLWLPPTIASVTLIADRDDSDGARQQLDRAVAAHAGAGRIVRVWQNQTGGKDLNDALLARAGEADEPGRGTA